MDDEPQSQIANRKSQVEGVVRAQLPSGLYSIEIDGFLGAARDRPQRITAHAGGPEKNFVRLLVGDRVVVELSSRDVTRGRIVRKL
jgi:translation initiation factor IF-1